MLLLSAILTVAFLVKSGPEDNEIKAFKGQIWSFG